MAKEMNTQENITKSVAQMILQHNFVRTDFVYDDSMTPIGNLIIAIEMYGDQRYDDGDSNGYERGYTTGYDTGYSSGYDSAVINYMN